MLSAIESSIIASLGALTAIAPDIRIAVYRGEFRKGQDQRGHKVPGHTTLVDIHRLSFTRATGRRLRVEVRIRIYLSSMLPLESREGISSKSGTNELWEACLSALTDLKITNNIHLTSLVPGKFTKVANRLTEEGHLSVVIQTFRAYGEMTVPEPIQPETKGIDLRYRLAPNSIDEVAKDIID
jgi:hypothetical protein